MTALTTYHLGVDVALALEAGDLSHFTDSVGRRLTRNAARAELEKCLAAGINFLPVGDCPAFDPKTGCPGHKEH